MSPISSRKSVPPWAASSNPCLACTAPVKAPLTYPNSSDSISVGTSAEQSTGAKGRSRRGPRSEEHTSELQSHLNIVCRLLLEKKKHQLLTITTHRITSTLAT